MHLVIALGTRPLMSIEPKVQKKHNNSKNNCQTVPSILITQADLNIPGVSIISCTCQRKLSAQQQQQLVGWGTKTSQKLKEKGIFG